MQPKLTLKTVAVLFLAVLVLYLAAFYGLEWWQHRKGPWEVTFAADEAGTPAITVRQPRLQVAAAQVVFRGEQVAHSNLPQTVRFEQPLQPVPFGRVIYEDLLALPGVVTFDLFGHEIELLPRTLLVNRKQVPWQPPKVIELRPSDKPATPPKPPKGFRQ